LQPGDILVIASEAFLGPATSPESPRVPEDLAETLRASLSGSAKDLVAVARSWLESHPAGVSRPAGSLLVVKRTKP
jgi:hypothetical protein